MKILKFIASIIVTVIVFTAINLWLGAPQGQISWTRAAPTIIFALTPALATMYSQPAGLKTIGREYLSFKETKWATGFGLLTLMAIGYSSP